MRNYFVGAALLVVFVLCLYLNLTVTNLAYDPIVLLTGDFGDQVVPDDSFADSVHLGVRLARGKLKPSISPTIVRVQAKENPDQYRSALLRQIADQNVIGIISADISETAPCVIEIGRVFQIPTLLTVATSDSLLLETEGAPVVFRLLARNKLQADAIAKWRSDASESGRLGVLFDRTSYGIDLRRALEKAHGQLGFLQFELSRTTDIAGILKYGADCGVTEWIAIAYPDQAKEILSKKQALKIPGRILFSDGAYGQWLATIDDSSASGGTAFLAFPKPQVDSNGSSEDIKVIEERTRGYAAFGHDAYTILVQALEAALASGRRKIDLANSIPTVASELSSDHTLILEYQFAHSGENTTATFSIHEVSGGDLP